MVTLRGHLYLDNLYYSFVRFILPVDYGPVVHGVRILLLPDSEPGATPGGSTGSAARMAKTGKCSWKFASISVKIYPYMVINYFGNGCFRLQSGETSILVNPENNRLKADIILKTLTGTQAADVAETAESSDE